MPNSDDGSGVSQRAVISGDNCSATDRAHRIGQDKPVFVYRLIAENTLEEKILLMQTRKKAIAESVYKDETGEQTIGLTAKDIESLFAPAEEK